MSTGPSHGDARKPRVKAWSRILFIALLFSLPVITYVGHRNPFVVCGCLVVYPAAAVVLKSRLIIFTLSGILCGILFQPAVVGGTIEAQAWESIRIILFWTAVGVVMGFFADAVKGKPLAPSGSTANAGLTPQRHV